MEQEQKIYVGDVIKNIGKRTAITKWGAEGIVEMVEKLNPNFSDGEEILVYSEEFQSFKIIDASTYEDALVFIGQKQAENEAN
jgi:hypothetical protein